MVDAIAYFMDQHVPGPVSRALKRHGVDVLTAQEAGRCQLPDSEQLAFATSQQRVVFTFDSDYLALHLSGIQHAGIAWCPQKKYSIGELIQALLLLHAVTDRGSMQNQVEYL